MPVRAREKRGREFQGLRTTQEILVMLIRIQGMNGGEPYGDLIQYFLQEPVPFRNSNELVFRIVEIGRLLKPGAEEFHSLRGGCDRDRPGERSGQNAIIQSSGSEPEIEKGVIQSENLYLRFPAAGVKELFYLELIGRHNMSLQGRIRGRLTEGRPVCFRSALELMVMLSELELQPENG